jgi:hypothetical protein
MKTVETEIIEQVLSLANLELVRVQEQEQEGRDLVTMLVPL